MQLTFHLKVNNNQTVSLFETAATSFCMSTTCFDKLDSKLPLITQCTHKVHGTDGNSLGTLGTTTCTLEFPKKVQQQFIFCEHLLIPIILGLDFLHNYLIGINWFSTNQLHLHQGPQSIVVVDHMPFPLHINQISTLHLLHILVKKIPPVAIPARTLAIVPTIFTSNPKNNCYYNLTGTQSTLDQNIFVVPILKIFSTTLLTNLLCTIINFSPDSVILPRNRHISELTPLITATHLYTQYPSMR